MRKRFDLERCLEEFEVDKAIIAVNSEDNPTADALLDKAQAVVEEGKPEDNSDDADDAATAGETTPAEDKEVLDIEEEKTDPELQPETEEGLAVEAMFKGIDKALLALESLETIADIIESSEETGGLTASSIPVINTAINAVYSEIDFPQQPEIQTASLEKLSVRLSVAKEFISDIKDKVIAIWQAIVAQIKKIFNFLKEVWKARNLKANQDLQEIKKLRQAYNLAKTKLKDKPTIDNIRGPVFGALVYDYTSGTFADVVSANKKLLAFADEFISENTTSASHSKKTTQDIRKIVSDFVTELDSLLDATVAPDQTERIKAFIKQDPVLTAPKFTKYIPPLQSHEVETRVSEELPGAYQLQSIYPTAAVGEEGLDVIRLTIVSSKPKQQKNKIFESIGYPDNYFDLEKLFDIAEATVNKSIAMLKHLEELERMFSDFIKFSEQIEASLKKTDKFKSKDSYIFARHSSEFKKFVNACNYRYIQGTTNFDNYLYNYKNKLLSYAKHCLRAYL